MKKLIWDGLIIDHIRKHNVTVLEVEEAYLNKKIESETYLNRKKILGITKEINGVPNGEIMPYEKTKTD